jgi:ribosomal protein S18 acetylase RimI-like enzyme
VESADIAGFDCAGKVLRVTNPHELIIRRAEESDLEAVARVWHESTMAMDGSPDVPPREALRGRIDAELRSGWGLHVALRNGRVVGLLAVKPGEGSLDQIFVEPNDQGQGVGRAMLKVAKQVMPGGFTLRMAASNERAKRFYEQQGLELSGEGLHPQIAVPVLFFCWNVR